MSENIVKTNLELIKTNTQKIWDLERKMNALKKENKNLEKIIYKTCEHNWERDWDDLYSRHKVCTKCKLANIPYVYS
jgi:hypothetical protein